MDAFDYYYDGEGCYIITRNGHFFLSCCGSEAETKNIVELLRKDAERENGQMQSLRSSACLDPDGGRREMDAMQ